VAKGRADERNTRDADAGRITARRAEGGAMMLNERLSAKLQRVKAEIVRRQVAREAEADQQRQQREQLERFDPPEGGKPQ
jgi:hypothetical protein